MDNIPECNPNQRYNANQKEVELNPVAAIPLTLYDEEFFIPDVAEGQHVLVGRGLGEGAMYIQCDFSAFNEKLKGVTPEELDRLFVTCGKLEQQFPDLDEHTRKLLHACWRAARITRNMLGNVASEFERNRSFSRYRQKTADGQKVCVKPLSECQRLAVCAEFALMAHYILRILGIKSSIVIGAYSNDPQDQISDRHTFLVLEGGKYVFDPTHTAQQEECWPPKVFSPEIPITVESLQDMTTDPDKPFGRKIICEDLVTKEKRIYGSGAA